MQDAHAIWHHGLMAEYWAAFKRDVPELPGLLAFVQRFGQPVLDLGCGTGRVLLALLGEQVDVDGVDVSEDMIALARSAAAASGWTPALHVQPMSCFATGRSYRTILIADSFGLGGDRSLDLATLHRCRAALLPGGALVLNAQMEYTLSEAWARWTETVRTQLPEPWPDRAVERVAPDGSVYRLRIRTLATSPLRQTYTREMRIEKWVDGRMSAEQTSTLRGSMYLTPEVISMLRQTGFKHVELYSGFTNLLATDDSAEIVFVAH